MIILCPAASPAELSQDQDQTISMREKFSR